MEFRSALVHDGGEYNVTFFALMDLLWLLLEAGVALSLLLGFVWWTWPRARKDDAPPSDSESGK
jgi:hypothetical protein